MKTHLTKIALITAFGLALCFAQETPEKLAVYVSGASDAGVNKSLSGKLLSAMSQSGRYAEITDPAVFQDELAKSGKGDLASITQTAKRHGAGYVCVVSMTETFGAYSISARVVRISDSQIIKSGSADRTIKSLDDLTAVSNELASQLLPPVNSLPSPLPVAVAATSKVAPVAAAPKQCTKNYNINELLFKIKNGFPSKLKDCSSTLAKDMLNPFGKKLEPKSFMTQCTVDGIKKDLPDGFPNTDKIVNSLSNFVQNLLNSAMAGGAVDPRKLLSAIGSMDVDALLSDVKKLASGDCVVDEPYSPSVGRYVKEEEKEAEDEDGKSMVSFGIRAGMNFSHAYAEYVEYSYYESVSSVPKIGRHNYGDILGMQLGFVVDFAVSSRFHIQPGFMYIRKGMEDGDGSAVTAHYLEFPLLLSFKLDALRLNVGPYLDKCLTSDYGAFKNSDFDIGLSTGIGFDIGLFYIGMFYDYGFFDMGDIPRYNYYNRTLGLNVGINL